MNTAINFPSWIQAGAAGVSLVVTIVLSAITWRTLRANNRMAASAERQTKKSTEQISLMREQLDLEYVPNIVVHAIDTNRELMLLRITNLGKHPVHPVRIELQKIDDPEFPVHRGQVRLYQKDNPSQFKRVEALMPGESAYLGFVQGERSEYTLNKPGIHRIDVEFMYGSTGHTRHLLSHVDFDIDARRRITEISSGTLTH